jgi:hypothetical protein
LYIIIIVYPRRIFFFNVEPQSSDSSLTM